MSTTASATVTVGEREARRQVRGSSLLLVGRAFSLAVNFGTQILLVRYLTRDDYGAFAYALSLANAAQTFVTLGLDRAMPRFASIYDERRQNGRLLGMLAMQVGSVLGLGLALGLLIQVFHAQLSGTLIESPLAAGLLAILIFLAPLQALDDILVGLFAVFSRPRVIFMRKQVLGPILRLAVVLLLIETSSDVTFVSIGYVATATLGIVIYLPLLLRILRQRQIIAWEAVRTVSFPITEVFGFALPLLTTDLLYIVLQASDAIFIGYFHGPSEVARFRVVVPAAMLNQVVFSSFTLLFMPVASRMFSRSDTPGIRSLYWQTAIWMALLTFPIFALTFSFSEQVTVLLYEERYRDSAAVMAILAFGYYFNAALGFNGLTLRVFGKIRYTVVINLVAFVVSVVLCLVLIPPFGAIGGAIATGATLVIHNILKQAGLRLGTGISVFDPRTASVYAWIAGGALVLWAVQFAPLPLVAQIGIAALVSLAILAANRAKLDIRATFPEFDRIVSKIRRRRDTP
jgi:O-antigen/teichoic acid export membrane protein